jgi:flagellin-like hook-associated protein FlgL
MPFAIGTASSSPLAFGIGRNLAANVALRGLRSGTAEFARVSERLGTGNRINKASDDPSGAARIGRFRQQLAGIKVAQINGQLAASTLGVAQGGLSEIYNVLTTLRTVALRALGTDIASSDRSLVQDEADQLIGGLDRIVRDTKIGGNRVMDGSGDFQTTATPGAFQDLRVRRVTFAPGNLSRDFTVDLMRTAERATIATTMDLAGSGSPMQNGAGSFSLSGPLGSAQVDISPGLTARDFASQVNLASGMTGVYASSYLTTGTELRFDAGAGNPALSIENDLELTGGNQLQFDVTLGGLTRTVNLTATGDADNDGNPEVTAGDLELALNAAGLGSFSVISADDAGNRSLAIRHAGSQDFTLSNFAGINGAALAGGSALGGGPFTGTEPESARIITDGFTPAATPAEFAVQVIDGSGSRIVFIEMLSATPADFVAAFAEIATVTNLGTDSNGQQRLRFDALEGVSAFRFVDGPDARRLGLLSDSGGGDGLASRGMGVLGLYSAGFGSDQHVSLRNTSSNSGNFGLLNEITALGGSIHPEGGLSARGIDAAAMIGDDRVIGRGFHFEYGGNSANFSFDLSPTAGLGSQTNLINRAVNLNFADPSVHASLLGTRPLSQSYQGDSFALTNINDALGQALVRDGVIDRLTFTVHQQVDDATIRSGLGLQLSDSASGREHISIRDMRSSALGGSPGYESTVDSQSGKMVQGTGVLSDVLRGGKFDLEGDPVQVRHALAIIDRALSQTISEQASIGIFQTATLDRTRDRLATIEEQVGSALEDFASTDIAADAARLATAQLRVQAVTNILAQANSLPQTLLQLIGR